MPEYFVFRATDSDCNADEKMWLLGEIRKGRLRQGWLDNPGLRLVTPRGGLVSRDHWVLKARKVARTYGKPKYRTASFVKEKYRELITMLQIDPEDRIVIPSIDSRGEKNGFLLAVAAASSRRHAPRKNCYWWDGSKGIRFYYRHVVAVKGKPVTEIPNDAARFVSRKLERYRRPIERIRNRELIEAIRRLFEEKIPQIKQPVDSTDFKFQRARKARTRIEAEIAVRQGQGRFRDTLLQAYNHCCAVSDCDFDKALEAAHIVPHEVSVSDHVQNGLLLRADLHSLFDKGLLTCHYNGATLRLRLHPSLLKSSYACLEGAKLRLPASAKERPSSDAIKYHNTNVFLTK